MIVWKTLHFGIGTTVGGLIVAGTVTVAPQDEKDPKSDEPATRVAVRNDSDASTKPIDEDQTSEEAPKDLSRLDRLEAELQKHIRKYEEYYANLQAARFKQAQIKRLVELGIETPNGLVEVDREVPRLERDLDSLKAAISAVHRGLSQQYVNAQVDLERAAARAMEARRMAELGLVSSAQLEKREAELKRARERHDRIRARWDEARERVKVVLQQDAQGAEEPEGPEANETMPGAERLDLSGSLERRLETIERKLDRVLELLEAAEPSDDAAPSRR